MRAAMYATGVLGIATCVFEFATYRSDNQVAIALLGFFGGMISFGIAATLGALQERRIDVMVIAGKVPDHESAR